jgi:hypothetical protein
VQHPGVPSLLLVQACSGLAQSVFQSTFSLLVKQQYGLSSKANGMMLSYVGCCIVFGEYEPTPQLEVQVNFHFCRAYSGALLTYFL